ncbi:MAG: cyclic nucleotide-binding domain-containing protein [Balneolaceae bacterium]|nr:cyclic nucleotide-binding domain-containing protein [Balneolaceae bacterium]
MKFKLGKQWIEDRNQVTNVIRRLFDEDGEVDQYVKSYKKGTTLFYEGDALNDIYILLEGHVDLYKKKPNVDSEYPIISLEQGSLIGIIAFTTGEPSLTTARASEDISILKIPDAAVRSLIERNERFKKYMDELIMANLLERFRNTIILQMKLDSVNNKLREERNELQQAYRELKEAQDMLIYQEKMATLGQLVAGFAHEVNNPTASLLRSTETLKERIADLLNRFEDETRDKGFVNTLYDAGRKAGYPDTATIRERVKELKKTFGKAPQVQLRLLAQLPQHLIPLFIKKNVNDPAELEFYLSHFELGKLFQNIESAGNRIAGLVSSLKSYSRSDTDHEWEEADIREGIHDTLQLTSNRIKYYDIQIDLPEIPKIRVNPAALNQVWTNIVLNAADAMGKNGSLSIICNNDDENIWVEIRDSGPGIKEEIIDKIFESNFSTKKSEVKFGLGLGLSISKDIITQHGGTISAKNSQQGGAIFTVTLPLNN